MQARTSVGKCGGREAFFLPCHPYFAHSCLLPPSLPPSDCPPSRSKRGNGLLGCLPSISPSLTSPVQEDDRSANMEVACAEQTGKVKNGWKDLSSAASPTAHAHIIPKCMSARHLMHAIKHCNQWTQLFDLVQAHSPQNPNPLHLTSSNPQGRASVHEHLHHEVAPPIHSAHPQADLSLSPGIASTTAQQPQRASDLDAPTINHIHLAAILTHLAQLRVDPSADSALQTWCMELLHQVVQPHVLRALSLRQLANIMWACARLGMHGGARPHHPQVHRQHRLPAAGVGLGNLNSSSGSFGVRAWGGGRHTGVQARCWKALLGAHGQRMQEASLLLRAEQQQQQQQQQQNLQPPQLQQQQQQQQRQVNLLSVHDVVHVLYACALAGQDPGAEWLALSLQCSRPLLPYMRPAEAASWAYGLCALGVSPDPEWATAYVRASAGLLGAMTPHELALTVRGVPGIMHACSTGGKEVGIGSSSGSNRSNSSSSIGITTNSSSNSSSTRIVSTSGRLPSSTAGAAQEHWQRACFAALSHALPGLDAVHVCAALWGLSLLGWRPEPPLIAALLRVAVHGQRHTAAGDVINSWPELPEDVQGRLQEQAESQRAAAEGARAGSAAKEGAVAAGVRRDGLDARQGGRDGLDTLQRSQGCIAGQHDGLDAWQGGRGGAAAAAARSRRGGSEEGAAAIGLVAPELSGWCAANVLTATARLGVKPSGAWVGQLLNALIASARGRGRQEEGAATHSSSRSSSSSSSSKAGAFAPGHEAACSSPSQQQQQQQQQQRPCHDRATACRLLADVNASMLACVLLRYQPPPHVMHQLVGLAHEGLPWASPAEVADMLWAFAKLRYVPHRAWLAACFSATGRVLHRQALQQQHLRKQLAQQQQELQELQEGGSTHPLAPPRPSPPSPQQDDRHQEELQDASEQPQSTLHHHRYWQQQQQQQQQRHQQPQPGLSDGFDAHTLCKLLWALASLTKMQRATAPQASPLGTPQHQGAPPPHAQLMHPPVSHPAGFGTPAGAANQQDPPSQSQPAQQQQQQQLESQARLSQHGISQQSPVGASSPLCSTPSAPPPHQRTRSRRRHASFAQPPSPPLSPSPPPLQVPVSPQGAPPSPPSPATPASSPQQRPSPALHKPVATLGAPVPVHGGALPPRAPPAPRPPTAPTRSLGAAAADSEVDTHTPSQPADAPVPSLHSHSPPAAAPPRIPMQQPPLLPPAWLEASLAVLHTHIPQMEPQHLPEVLWALATLDAVPPAVSRRRLAAAVTQHVGGLSPKHVAAVVGGLPRVCITRVHDSCGMLGAVLGAGRATLCAMQPKELTYYLRGLHGMGYVLSKRALLQLAADLASYPDLQRLAAKDLVAVVDALAGLDMGLLPVTAELPSRNVSGGSNSDTNRISSTSSKTKRGSMGHNSTARSEGGKGASTASSRADTSRPLLRLQHKLLALLQPKLKYLRLPQIASLVTALAILGWRPPSSFWPCLYASIALKPAPTSGRVPAAVLLALAKYGGMAAAVEEADAAAAALRAESSAVGSSSGTGVESSSVSTGSFNASAVAKEAAGAATALVWPSQARQAPSTSGAATVAAAPAPSATGSDGRSSTAMGPGAQGLVQAEGSNHDSKAAADGGDGAAAGGGGSMRAAGGGGLKAADDGSHGVAAQGIDNVPLRSEPLHDQFLLPPGVLVQRMLDFVTGDLAALRPSEVAELVLALVRLRHDPGGSWMRALLDHLETRSAACNREDHQLLQRAWRRLSRARKAGLVRTHHKQRYLQAVEGGGERGASNSSSSSSMLRGQANPQRQLRRLPQHKRHQLHQQGNVIGMAVRKDRTVRNKVEEDQEQ